MEIVFSESACGGLRCAHLSGEVFGFSLGLSAGDISEDVPGEKRRAALWEFCRASGPEADLMKWLERTLINGAEALVEVLRRSEEGEPARLWYSGEPDELCGFCWMLARLDSLGNRRGPVGTVRLPRYEEREDGVLVEHMGWGGVQPERWRDFLPLERAGSPVFVRAAANRWRELQEENAPLRAVVNGRLVSVGEDFYDGFLRRELDRTPVEFHEARFIGNVLGRFRLGIGDALVANRVEAMIQSGELEAVTRAAEGEPGYRRILRKRA